VRDRVGLRDCERSDPFSQRVGPFVVHIVDWNDRANALPVKGANPRGSSGAHLYTSTGPDGLTRRPGQSYQSAALRFKAKCPDAGSIGGAAAPHEERDLRLPRTTAWTTLRGAPGRRARDRSRSTCRKVAAVEGSRRVRSTREPTQGWERPG